MHASACQKNSKSNHFICFIFLFFVTLNDPLKVANFTADEDMEFFTFLHLHPQQQLAALPGQLFLFHHHYLIWNKINQILARNHSTASFILLPSITNIWFTIPSIIPLQYLMITFFLLRIFPIMTKIKLTVVRNPYWKIFGIFVKSFNQLYIRLIIEIFSL